MTRKHIAFIVESAHGHIHPTLPITASLCNRGYRVTYAVTEYFKARVVANGGEAKIYKPLQTKVALFRELQRVNPDGQGDFAFDFSRLDLDRYLKEDFRREVQDTRAQLESLYHNDRPDLIVYDCMNPAGQSLALEWHIPVIEHSPMLIEPEGQYASTMVIVSLPAFFQKNAQELGSKFHFVGPLYTDSKIFAPWKGHSTTEPIVLVSATTGLLPELSFYSTAIRAFQSLPWHVVLSIPEDLSPESLNPLPNNVEINRFASLQDILAKSSLYVGQGGPSGIFEALRFAVPLLLVPPSPAHDVNARRVAELGLGIRLLQSGFSPETVRNAACSLVNDAALRDRLREVQVTIRGNAGAERTADLIDQYLNTFA